MDNSVSGILEIVPKGYGFLRDIKDNLAISPTDPYVAPKIIHKLHLRNGMYITGSGRKLRNQPNIAVEKIESVNGLPPDEVGHVTPFHKLTAIDPDEQLHFTTGREPVSPRVIDLFVPIGKGQRVLIVSPPKAGKTTVMEEIANGIEINHPEVHLVVFLVDERPEESTHFKRTVKGEIISTDFDRPNKEHIRVAHLVFERVKCLAEEGKDVVLIIDSLTRLGRAFNRDFDSRGKTLTGGLSSGALTFPRRFYGSARNTEEKGSLTIIASILVDTGSKMDELIFQEFKGTGNSELVLDRYLADSRIFPAVNFQQSGTRKEEKLMLPETLRKANLLRRAMMDDKRGEKYRMFLAKFRESENNEVFLDTIPDPATVRR